MSDYKKHADRLIELRNEFGLFDHLEFAPALAAAIALCEAAAGGEDERGRCRELVRDWAANGANGPGATGNLVDRIMRERAAARAPVEAELAELKAECDELQRLGRSGYTITMERRLRDSREQHAALADAAREAEAMLRMSGGTGFAETAANLRAALSGAPVSELLRNLQVTTDAHGAAELRIVELREERDELQAKHDALLGALLAYREEAGGWCGRRVRACECAHCRLMRLLEAP